MTSLDRLFERWAQRVLITETCWLWQGTLTRAGYGHFNFEGRTYIAHRVALAMSDKYFTPQHVAGTRAGAEGYQAMTTPLEKYNGRGLLDVAPEEEYYLTSAADAALAEVRAEVSRLEAIKTPDASFTYCAYCGEKSPVDDHNEDLSAHIKTCPKHPMRDVEQQLAEVTKLSESRRTTMEHQATMLDDYVQQLASKDRRLAVVEGALKAIAEPDPTPLTQADDGSLLQNVDAIVEVLNKCRAIAKAALAEAEVEP